MSNVQLMLPVSFNRDRFDDILSKMSDDDAGAFAAANRGTFGACFAFGDAPATAPVKAAPKAATGAKRGRKPKSGAVSAEALTAAVREAMTVSPKETGAGYTAMLAADFGAGDEKFGVKVKKILEGFVDAKTACCEGERKARRYWPMPESPASDDDAAASDAEESAE